MQRSFEVVVSSMCFIVYLWLPEDFIIICNLHHNIYLIIYNLTQKNIQEYIKIYVIELSMHLKNCQSFCNTQFLGNDFFRQFLQYGFTTF